MKTIIKYQIYGILWHLIYVPTKSPPLRPLIWECEAKHPYSVFGHAWYLARSKQKKTNEVECWKNNKLSNIKNSVAFNTCMWIICHDTISISQGQPTTGYTAESYLLNAFINYKLNPFWCKMLAEDGTKNGQLPFTGEAKILLTDFPLDFPLLKVYPFLFTFLN